MLLMRKFWGAYFVGAFLAFNAFAGELKGTQLEEARGIERTFPRLMGMNIGAKKKYSDPHYIEMMARLDVVILGFYPTWTDSTGRWSIRHVVQALKRKNPAILVGQYTILSEAPDSNDKRYADSDKGRKLDSLDAWLRDDDGRRVQWTEKYDAWEVNVTRWAPSDRSGRQYPQWLAERDYKTYFRDIPEFDVWYFDNVLIEPAVAKADWDRDGKNDRASDSRIAQAYREGHVMQWERVRALSTKLLLMGNAPDLSSEEYSDKLQGAFLEAIFGASWSLERRQGWGAAMRRYRAAMSNVQAPRLVGFNVHGERDDYRLMRYGLTSCLMDDGFFSFTDKALGYSSVTWFDEYDIDLGLALDNPQTSPIRRGIYARRFENGIVLLNPTDAPEEITIDKGYRRFRGKQAPDVNSGKAVSTIRLAARDGIILVRDR